MELRRCANTVALLTAETVQRPIFIPEGYQSLFKTWSKALPLTMICVPLSPLTLSLPSHHAKWLSFGATRSNNLSFPFCQKWPEFNWRVLLFFFWDTTLFFCTYVPYQSAREFPGITLYLFCGFRTFMFLTGVGLRFVRLSTVRKCWDNLYYSP